MISLQLFLSFLQAAPIHTPPKISSHTYAQPNSFMLLSTTDSGLSTAELSLFKSDDEEREIAISLRHRNTSKFLAFLSSAVLDIFPDLAVHL